MIDDARRVPAGARVRTGVCIVGGGPAGITIARELAAARDDVVLLESGGLEFRPDVQDLYRGTSSGIAYDVSGSRLRFLGGSINHWGGWCRPLDDVDFETRPWVPHSGWPFGRGELEPHYERAQQICELGPYRYESRWWRRRLPGVVPPLDTATIRTDLIQVGPAIHFGQRYRAELRQARNLRVLLHANAVNVRVDGRRVVGVDVATLNGAPVRGRRRRRRARLGRDRERAVAARVARRVPRRYRERTRSRRPLLHGTSALRRRSVRPLPSCS